jgi:hypothetical protein
VLTEKKGFRMKSEGFRMPWAPLIPLFLFMLTSIVSAENTVDQSIYGALLEKYVKNGVVDYKGFKSEEKKLDRYLEILNKADVGALSRGEQFAVYINAYNAYTIKLILKNYPVNSIKKIAKWKGGPWKIRFCKIGGKTLTLDEIEHDILRPEYKDPRVHFAVNCASKSCPPLISEPYQGDIVDRQLDSSTRKFINDPKENRLEGNTLYVSSMFKWFKEDFGEDIVGFFLKYAEGDLRENLMAKKDQIKVKYLKYDWSLNGN